MKDWIIKNTNVKEEQYDNIFNTNIVMINGVSKKATEKDASDHPIINISMFTFDYPTFFRIKKFKIKKIKDTNKKNLYIYKNIKFYILGEQIPLYANELFTGKRITQCFYLNSTLCLQANLNSYLITAMCKNPYRKNNDTYLHTFVLLKHDNGQDYILDGTANIITDKKTYFNIFKPNIISCISKEKLKKDLELLKPFEESMQIYRPEYLCFTKETVKAAKKLTKQKTTQR